MSGSLTKKIAISQSNYVPWKGYFDIINSVDHFVLYDDMQYTRRDWRNRNRIKTREGVQWLTIPVNVAGKYHQKICETTISDPQWPARHWEVLRRNYGEAPCFKEYQALFEDLYCGTTEEYLSLVNRRFLEAICQTLGIQTRFSWSSEYRLEEDRTDRLVSICQATSATHYYTGPAAKAYMDEDKFRAAGIDVVYYDYSGYPEYNQLYPPFEHAVSIIDLIFHTGHDAPRYLKSFDQG